MTRIALAVLATLATPNTPREDFASRVLARLGI